MTFFGRIAPSLAAALLLILPACAAAGPGGQSQDQTPAKERTTAPEKALSPAGLALTDLTVHSGERIHAFTVEIARTPEQQATGLMFRSTLGEDEGMIFPFPAPRQASFWMKNTVIPLDIIFIRPDGTIESIARDTVPYSLDSVQSGEPVMAVLEIAGGRAAALGIERGDRVSWND